MPCIAVPSPSARPMAGSTRKNNTPAATPCRARMAALTASSPVEARKMPRAGTAPRRSLR